VGHPAHARSEPERSRFRHRPESTVLYQTVAEHWPAFLERAGEHGGLPRFVVKEFEEYLRCGRPEHGCLHLVCRDCGYSEIVAFSCKNRGFCASCLGRRMADTAVHLERSVLPRVPIRHWICSLPWGLRALLGYDRKLCAEVVSAFMAEVDRSLRWRAKRELGLASVAEAYTGSVVAVQRTDSALRLNVHFHALWLDGVYVHADNDPRSPLEFRELDTPTQADVAEVAARTAARIEKILRAHGRSLDPELGDDEPPALCHDEPGLAACYAAAAQGVSVSGERAGKPLLRLIASPDPPARSRAADASDDPWKSPGGDQPIAEVRGINIHAVQVIDGRDRRRVERVCKYITRPPVAQDRLERRPDGKLELSFKNVWRDGTRALAFEPEDLIARLVAAVPPPRWHLLRYFGVLSSHSSRRSLVVPTPPLDATANKPPPARGDQLELLGESDDAPVPRKRWAWLLAHVFSADLENCPRCSGPMRWAEVANTRAQITRLLAEHGLGPRAPPTTRAPTRVPEQLQLGFGEATR
jgi:hypothetical protein